MTRFLTWMFPVLLLSVACSESESSGGGSAGSSSGGAAGSDAQGGTGATSNGGAGGVGATGGSAQGGTAGAGTAGSGASTGGATGGSGGATGGSGGATGGSGGATGGSGGATGGGAGLSSGGGSAGGAAGTSAGGTGGFDPGVRPKGQCTKNSDCPGNICNHAVPGGQCQGGGCPSGAVNEPGIGCIIECTSTDDCPWGMECGSTGRCLIMACSGGMCPLPFFDCSSGTDQCTRKDCTMQSDCPADTTCKGGHCIEDWAL